MVNFFREINFFCQKCPWDTFTMVHYQDRPKTMNFTSQILKINQIIILPPVQW